jgi:multimeric flavodoxin WrbA
MIVVLAGTNRPGCNTLKVAEQVHDILEAGAQEVRLLNLQDLPRRCSNQRAMATNRKPLHPFRMRSATPTAS